MFALLGLLLIGAGAFALFSILGDDGEDAGTGAPAGDDVGTGQAAERLGGASNDDISGNNDAELMLGFNGDDR